MQYRVKALNGLLCADVPLRNYSITKGGQGVLGTEVPQCGQGASFSRSWSLFVNAWMPKFWCSGGTKL